MKNLVGKMGQYIKAEMFRRITRESHDKIVILDVPLLIEAGWDKLPLHGTIVVDCPVETAVSRLIEFRGFTKEEVELRLAKQTNREDRLARADYVINNDKEEAQLMREIIKAWLWIKKTSQYHSNKSL
jgi:dephospho-CoA kinase